MATMWQVTVDCRSASTLADFWSLALGYVHMPPPEGFATWEEWYAQYDLPEDEAGDDDAGAAIMDPDGTGPRICFLRVPEGKSVKNRLHIDVLVNGHRADWRPETQEQRLAQVRATVARLTAAGGTVLNEDRWAGQLDHVVMADPEGNEFCVR